MMITREHVRRFPFAVNPSRITAADEAAIAKDMAERCKAEGHMKRTPPSNGGTNNMRAREKLDTINAQIVNLMRDGKRRQIKEIAAWCNEALYDVRYACLGLAQMGVLRHVDGTGRSQIGAEYEHSSAPRIRAGKLRIRRVSDHG